MKCPKCESENTQRLEVAFHGGTQDINTTSKTAGGGIGGAFGVGGAVTKTSGQSQSLLAQKAAPPVKKSFKWAIILILLGIFLFWKGINQTQTMNALISLLIFSGSGAFWAFSSFKYNSNNWPGLYQHWLNSWLCNRCGTVYHQA